MNHCPVIFVHGILGWGPNEKGFGKYWGQAHEVEKHFPETTVAFASVGPISSHWDRARELFYQIKTNASKISYRCRDLDEHHIHQYTPYQCDPVKKDEGNSGIHKDAPLYAEWSDSNPIHLVGHSQGAWTILLLQYMLRNKLFDDFPNTNEDWILSVTSISGVLNGTTVPYGLIDFDVHSGLYPGEDPANCKQSDRQILPKFFALNAPDLLRAAFDGVTDTQVSFVQFVYQLLTSIGIGCYNWDLEQWDLERSTPVEFIDDLIQNVKDESLIDVLNMSKRFLLDRSFGFVRRIGKSDFLYGKDNAGYSLSVKGTCELNELYQSADKTYYFSFVTRQETPDIYFALKHFERAIKNYDITEMRDTQWWAEATKLSRGLWPFGAETQACWRESDGLVPVISQVYPWLGVKQEHFPKVIRDAKHPLDINHSDDDGKGSINNPTDVTAWPKQCRPGYWHVMDEALANFDHTDIVAFEECRQKDRQRAFYVSLLTNLTSLTQPER